MTSGKDADKRSWRETLGVYCHWPIIQIFLMGIFFQMAIRWLYVKTDNDLLFVPLWLLSVAIGLYVPTLIAMGINRYAPRWLKMCFGL